MSSTTSLRTDRGGGDAGGAAPTAERKGPLTGLGLLVYLLIGVYLGIVFTKSEVVSWFRIQEMFRFQSFHMYGIIGAAVIVAAVSVALIKRRHARTVRGEAIGHVY